MCCAALLGLPGRRDLASTGSLLRLAGRPAPGHLPNQPGRPGLQADGHFIKRVSSAHLGGHPILLCDRRASTVPSSSYCPWSRGKTSGSVWGEDAVRGCLLHAARLGGTRRARGLSRLDDEVVMGEVSTPNGKPGDRNTLGRYLSRGRRSKTINDELHYLCTGPAHGEPTWLPATEEYFNQDRSPRAYGFSYRCRLCANWSKLKGPSRGVSGLVPADAARPFTVELVNRIGMMEASRRTGLAPDVLRRVINNGRERKVEKLTLRKVMLTLIDVREKGEVRHPASIAHGAAARGKTERPLKGTKARGPRS